MASQNPKPTDFAATQLKSHAQIVSDSNQELETLREEIAQLRKTMKTAEKGKRGNQGSHERSKEHVVLLTVLRKSGESATFIQQGATFLSHFKKTIPAFLSNHALIYDNFSIAVRKRMFDAISPSFDIELPKVGTVSIAYVAILASTVLDAANGGSLVSTLTWDEKDETHILDVIKFSALQKYLDKAAEADLKAARAAYYFDNSFDDYDDVPILSSIYDE